jgi:cell division protein FtsN
MAPTSLRPPSNKAYLNPDHFIESDSTASSISSAKYYVQIGAFDSKAALKRAAARVDPKLPRKILSRKINASKAKKPLYRLLIGPFNPGEAAAALQRFQRAGYEGAFIRQLSL